MFEAAGDKPEEGEDVIKSSCCSATDALGFTFATMAGIEGRDPVRVTCF